MWKARTRSFLARSGFDTKNLVNVTPPQLRRTFYDVNYFYFSGVKLKEGVFWAACLSVEYLKVSIR